MSFEMLSYQTIAPEQILRQPIFRTNDCHVTKKHAGYLSAFGLNF